MHTSDTFITKNYSTTDLPGNDESNKDVNDDGMR